MRLRLTCLRIDRPPHDHPRCCARTKRTLIDHAFTVVRTPRVGTHELIDTNRLAELSGLCRFETPAERLQLSKPPAHYSRPGTTVGVPVTDRHPNGRLTD